MAPPNSNTAKPQGSHWMYHELRHTLRLREGQWALPHSMQWRKTVSSLSIAQWRDHWSRKEPSDLAGTVFPVCEITSTRGLCTKGCCDHISTGHSGIQWRTAKRSHCETEQIAKIWIWHQHIPTGLVLFCQERSLLNQIEAGDHMWRSPTIHPGFANPIQKSEIQKSLWRVWRFGLIVLSANTDLSAKKNEHSSKSTSCTRTWLWVFHLFQCPKYIYFFLLVYTCNCNRNPSPVQRDAEHHECHGLCQESVAGVGAKQNSKFSCLIFNFMLILPHWFCTDKKFSAKLILLFQSRLCILSLSNTKSFFQQLFWPWYQKSPT